MVLLLHMEEAAVALIAEEMMVWQVAQEEVLLLMELAGAESLAKVMQAPMVIEVMLCKVAVEEELANGVNELHMLEQEIERTRKLLGHLL